MQLPLIFWFVCMCEIFSYDECVGPGSTQIYIPTDDPPPYSLLDPCQTGLEQEEQPSYTVDPSPYCGETSASAGWFSPSHYPLGLQEQEHQQIASISFPLEAAPPVSRALWPRQGHPSSHAMPGLLGHQSDRGQWRLQQPGSQAQMPCRTVDFVSLPRCGLSPASNGATCMTPNNGH
ncbi:protein BEAN1-like protein [Lates japonicus]|uniref:Protein BEAN1-like protein n=1 Tax=Lates japonicus TaxID=270547 RepID=A0AAD3RHV7_LATJO|nr:protein BEAN1-like protein [Lates japonicus]